MPKVDMVAPAIADAAGVTGGRKAYLTALEWGFAAFNSTRVLTYLPTLWAIHRSGDSSQHSILTWLCWTAANTLMAAWLYEHQGRRLNRAIAVNMVNAAMCLVTSTLIVAYR